MYPLVKSVPQEYCPDSGNDIDAPPIDQEYLDRLYQEHERKYAGHVLAIEPETGQYFVGEDDEETVRRAEEAFPDASLFFTTIPRQSPPQRVIPLGKIISREEARLRGVTPARKDPGFLHRGSP